MINVWKSKSTDRKKDSWMEKFFLSVLQVKVRPQAQYKAQYPVLRIRNFYPGSDFLILDPGFALKNISIVTQKLFLSSRKISGVSFFLVTANIGECTVFTLCSVECSNSNSAILCLLRQLGYTQLLSEESGSRARIFKLILSTRIDSKEPIPPVCVAWRTSTTTLFLLGSQPPYIIQKYQL